MDSVNRDCQAEASGTANFNGCLLRELECLALQLALQPECVVQEYDVRFPQRKGRNTPACIVHRETKSATERHCSLTGRALSFSINFGYFFGAPKVKPRPVVNTTLFFVLPGTGWLTYWSRKFAFAVNQPFNLVEIPAVKFMR